MLMISYGPVVHIDARDDDAGHRIEAFVSRYDRRQGFRLQVRMFV
jgi:hypothetical protein